MECSYLDSFLLIALFQGARTSVSFSPSMLSFSQWERKRRCVCEGCESTRPSRASYRRSNVVERCFLPERVSRDL